MKRKLTSESALVLNQSRSNLLDLPHEIILHILENLRNDQEVELTGLFIVSKYISNCLKNILENVSHMCLFTFLTS